MRANEFFKYLAAVGIIGLFTGCANWALQESCEKTNWFEYSQQVAFQGKYLEEDGFVKACKGIDMTSAVQLDLGFKQGREKMCQYDEIYGRAKEGTPVFFKFCDGLEMNRMKQVYHQGLLSYCTVEKGYSFARSGKTYQNLCTPEQEKGFLPAYYKGRREYLNSYLVDLRGKLADLKMIESSYSLTESRIHSEYSNLPSNATVCRVKQVYNEATKANESRNICEEAFYIRSRRTSLWGELDEVRGKLHRVRNEWRQTDDLIHQAQLDLSALP